MTIDTGDTVFHRPTCEDWLVAFVDGDRIAWCGWPEGTGGLADCELLEKATPDARAKLLADMAAMHGDDPRARYARRVLAENPAKETRT